MPGKWTVCWARGCDFFVIVLKRSHKLSCDIPQFLRLGTTTNCATLQFSSPWIKYERRPVHRLTRAQTLPGSTLVLPVLTIMVWQSIVICLKQVARGSLQKECKCHGVTGSCNLKTCWKQLAPFAVVGSALKQKYLTAVPVSFKNNKIHEKHSRDSVSSKKCKKLVYLDSSQTTAYETLLLALLESWEGPAQVTLDTPRNADLFVNLVTCGLKPKNITHRWSADVHLCGAVLWNASYALSNIPLQLVQNRLTPCGKKF